MSLQLYVDHLYASPYALSAFVTLEEKQLPFELTRVDLAAGAQFDAQYAARSLTRRVPMLVHDGFTLSESSAIVEYLDEVFPARRVLPTDTQARARARQVQAWLRSDLMPIRTERPTLVLYYGPSDQPLSAEAQDAAAKLFAFADALLPAGAEHLFGDWSIADAELALMLNRLVLNGDAVPARLADYARRQWQRPSVQQWVGKVRPPL